MTYAGTSTYPAKQPKTASVTGPWHAIVAAILVIGLAAGIAVTANLTKTSAAPAANPNQIQSQPGLNVHKVVGHKGAMIYQ